VINLDPVPGTVTLSFFGEDGTQIGSSRALVIGANGKIHIEDQSFFSPVGSELLQGFVQIVGSGIRLTGSIVFGDKGNKGLTSALPLDSSLRKSILFGHIASNDLYFTGIAIVNPNSSDANLTIDLYGADGLIQSSKPVRIPPRQRKCALLTNFFPQLIGQDRISGYVKVTADSAVSSFALFGTNKLSVLSAIPPQTGP
jgi:hypothetical protein